MVPIEKLWTSQKSGKYPGKYNRGHATYARHMGEIAPDVPAFQFTRSTNVPTEARRLARLYATVGLEFAKAIAAYESLLPLLKQCIDMLGAYPERYTCCLYLMGRKADAHAFVEEFLPLHQDYFKGFAVPFLQMLEDGNGKKEATAR